jgi:hypothetical protein
MVITDGNGDLSFTNIPSGGGIDSTIIIGGWGIEAIESPLNTWNLVADTTQVATLYDISGKTNGSGTTNYISKFTNSTTIGNSQLQDNGTTVGLGIAPNASYKFNVGSGNMKIGDLSTASTMNKLYFGDGTFVYVGEDVVDDRLYLRGSSLSIQTGGSLGANGNVLTSNGTTASWVAPAAATATNLTYTGTASPITLQPSGGGSNVRFLAGSNITLSRSGTDMTISAAGGGGVPGTGAAGQVTFWTAPSGVPTLSGSSSFFWDNGNVRLGLGTAAPTRLLDVNGSVRFRSVIYDSNNNGGTVGDNIASNGIGAWYWQHDGNYTFGQMSVDGNNSMSLSTTFSTLDFTASESSNTTVDVATNNRITVPAAGTYEFTFSGSFKADATNQYEIRIHKNGTSVARSQMLFNVANTAHYYPVSKTYIATLAANDYVDLRIKVASGTTTMYYEMPVMTVKRLK